MNGKEFHRKIWEILEPLDSSNFQVLRAVAAANNDIEKIEAQTEIKLPDYYRDFVSSGNCNGLAVCARDEVWPAPKEGDIAPAWTFYRGVTLLGIDAPDLPEFASIAETHDRLIAKGIENVLPLIKIWGNGSSFYGVNRSGETVIAEDDEVTILKGDLTDVYAELIANLDRYQKDMEKRLEASRGLFGKRR